MCCREARVMDQTHETLKHLKSRVEVPHSVPGLVTGKVLVMNFLNGTPLNQLAAKARDMPVPRRKMALKMVRYALLLQ
jgi:predicted unusual protein kinase regulating ubiquinone biosynthesis (AarF/ABC1/UbiB family)